MSCCPLFGGHESKDQSLIDKLPKVVWLKHRKALSSKPLLGCADFLPVLEEQRIQIDKNYILNDPSSISYDANCKSNGKITLKEISDDFFRHLFSPTSESTDSKPVVSTPIHPALSKYSDMERSESIESQISLDRYDWSYRLTDTRGFNLTNRSNYGSDLESEKTHPDSGVYDLGAVREARTGSRKSSGSAEVALPHRRQKNGGDPQSAQRDRKPTADHEDPDWEVASPKMELYSQRSNTTRMKKDPREVNMKIKDNVNRRELSTKVNLGTARILKGDSRVFSERLSFRQRAASRTDCGFHAGLSELSDGLKQVSLKLDPQVSTVSSRVSNAIVRSIPPNTIGKGMPIENAPSSANQASPRFAPMLTTPNSAPALTMLKSSGRWKETSSKSSDSYSSGRSSWSYNNYTRDLDTTQKISADSFSRNSRVPFQSSEYCAPTKGRSSVFYCVPFRE